MSEKILKISENKLKIIKTNQKKYELSEFVIC
jgi:hypothetical protein